LKRNCEMFSHPRKCVRIVNLERIKAAIDVERLIEHQEVGFVAYSEGRVVVPQVGYLGFPEIPGDCHIKYGYIWGEDHFVVKIATGFYKNPAIGLPVGNGMMIVFSHKTGVLDTILLDEGFLTDIRTAAAGAIAAKYLAPKKIDCIGIVGTGVQARLQLEMLRHVTECRDVIVWGRNEAGRERYKDELSELGFCVRTVSRLDELAAESNLIVTTTPSREALLFAEQIRPGTHITAVGADAEGKQELDANIFTKADVVVADSRSQCIDHGDTSHAIKDELIDRKKLIELGEVVKNPNLGRTSDDQISVADLTGVAVQDIQIATMVCRNLWLDFGYSMRLGIGLTE
jgi:ornithine cyclodeaminase